MCVSVHSFDTSDRENDSVVTELITMQRSRSLCSIARVDVPTTDEIAINDYVDPHITNHQGGSEYRGYHL